MGKSLAILLLAIRGVKLSEKAENHDSGDEIPPLEKIIGTVFVF
jgi:hypothetical protein